MAKSPGVGGVVGGFCWAIWKISQNCIQDSNFYTMTEKRQQRRYALILFIVLKGCVGCECARPPPARWSHPFDLSAQASWWWRCCWTLAAWCSPREKMSASQTTNCNISRVSTCGMCPTCGIPAEGPSPVPPQWWRSPSPSPSVGRKYLENEPLLQGCMRENVFPPTRKQERLTGLGTMGSWSSSGSYAFIIGRLFIGICILTGATVKNKTNKQTKKPTRDQKDQSWHHEVRADSRQTGKLLQGGHDRPKKHRKLSLPYPHIHILVTSFLFSRTFFLTSESARPISLPRFERVICLDMRSLLPFSSWICCLCPKTM